MEPLEKPKLVGKRFPFHMQQSWIAEGSVSTD